MTGSSPSPLSRTETPDFVILGGGTCGCWLAAELIERYGFRVTIIEAGVEQEGEWYGQERRETGTGWSADRGAAQWTGFARQPAKWIRELGGPQDWRYHTEPAEALAGRKLVWPRGRGFGGSSRINAMIWTPPTPQDLRALHQAGGEHWTPDQMWSAFQRAERLVKPEAPRFIAESTRLFLQAAERFTCESETAHHPCVYQRTNRRGRRWTAADRLSEMHDQHLERLRCIQGNIKKLLFDGNAACAVELDAGGESHSVTARHGVILCAGAIATPALLQRSGIGDGDVLERAAIPLKIENPGVGVHLKDHLLMPVIYRRKSGPAFPGRFNPRELAQWNSVGRGPVVSNLAEAGGLFDDSRIQLHVTPTHYLTYPRKTNPPSMTLGVNLTRPKSAGRVIVGSHGTVQIQSNYLHEPQDIEGLTLAVELAREIASTAPLAGALSEEQIPGPRFSSSDRLVSAIARYTQTLYHPVGTCAMGGAENHAVGVDLRLKKADRLWVVDASVLPEIPTTNPTGTLLALATHAASLIQKFVSPMGIP